MDASRRESGDPTICTYSGLARIQTDVGCFVGECGGVLGNVCVGVVKGGYGVRGCDWEGGEVWG